MRVLGACEYSGRVRDAFRALGHDAWSCDLLPSEVPSPHHFQCDVREAIEGYPPFDLMVAHPPCTHLAVSGARHFKEKVADVLLRSFQRSGLGGILYQGVADAMAAQWGRCSKWSRALSAQCELGFGHDGLCESAGDAFAGREVES